MPDSPVSPFSSLTTTFRALVMLVCLVGIPAIALRGTSLGDVVRRFLLEKLDSPPSTSDVRGGAMGQAPLSAPWPTDLVHQPSGAVATPRGRYRDEGGYPPNVATGALPPGTAPAWPPIAHERAATQPSGLVQPIVQPVVQPAYAGQAGGGPAAHGPPPGSAAGGFHHAEPIGYHEDPRALGARLASGHLPTSPATPRAEAGPVARPFAADPPEQVQSVDQFVAIQQRLRDLGASYYLLESWGDQGECYRFHCRVAVVGSSNFTKHFECTDRDPLNAMTRVLGEIEIWRRSSQVDPQAGPAIEMGNLPSVPAGPGSPQPPYLR